MDLHPQIKTLIVLIVTELDPQKLFFQIKILTDGVYRIANNKSFLN